ncbi:nuclear transport factor 2 family protein [Winogradskyella endarachnes]|uniref:SnoaL-like domain-containing protein n=1 Tax=Winogradskyella endarachnes TaxID=2681965 RepID=A0A6L6UE42_9FLAO|nr:nuclear transport factor 2 family protein [Winogradskyella endarachnes]MUU79087.1 hypothetical protein [Winogradskyella endarachnes]
MNATNINEIEKFILNYFKLYSARDLGITDLFTEDFIGLDGITQTIYNKEKWIEAIKNDYNQINYPFKISIIEQDARVDDSGLIISAVVSFWDIPYFKDFPEFDKMRSILVLKPEGDSFKIAHLSNSISLVTINKKEVYPLSLINLLRSFK